MKRPSAKCIKTTTDESGVRYLTFRYLGSEYTITDEDDEPMVDKHIREQNRIDARLERQRKVEEQEEQIYDVDEIFRRLGWA